MLHKWERGQGLTQYMLVPGCIMFIFWLIISGVLSVLLEWSYTMGLLPGCAVTYLIFAYSAARKRRDSQR